MNHTHIHTAMQSNVLFDVQGEVSINVHVTYFNPPLRRMLWPVR